MDQTERKEGFDISCHILGNTHFVRNNIASQELLINHIFAIVFNGILIVPTVLLNSLAIITICKSPQLKTKPCYFIIFVQSITDLAVGVLAIPVLILLLSSEIGGISNCIASALALKSTTIPMGLSTIALSAMTLERYIAILHPYSYKTWVTRKLLLIYIVSLTLLQFAVMIVSLKIQKVIEIYSTMFLILIFFFIAYAYTRIYAVVRRLDRSQRKLNVAEGEQNITKTKLILQQIKLAKSCFIVVICFCVLCFLPTVIAIPALNSLDQSEFRAILTWVITLGMLNSSANSVIFFWTKVMLRKEALKVLNIAACQR